MLLDASFPREVNARQRSSTRQYIWWTKAGLNGMTKGSLSVRWHDVVDNGVLARSFVAGNFGSVSYALTLEIEFEIVHLSAEQADHRSKAAVPQGFLSPIMMMRREGHGSPEPSHVGFLRWTWRVAAKKDYVQGRKSSLDALLISWDERLDEPQN